MKRIAVLVVLAALGLVAAGCGSAKKVVVKKGGSVSIDMLTTTESTSNSIGISFGDGYTIEHGMTGVTITVNRTATIPHVKPGTVVRCKGGGPSVKVTKRVRVNGSSTGDYGVDEGGGSSGSTRERHIELSHSPNGTITVSCK